jgi:hypothetical protein
VTDVNGIFEYDSVDTGRFTIAVNYRDSLGALAGIAIDTADTQVSVEVKLGLLGSVDGRLDTALLAGRDSVSLYLPELHLVVTVNPDGSFAIPSVPAWVYAVRVMVGDSVVNSPLDTIPIPVREGDTTIVRNLGGRTGTVVINGSVVEEP